MKKKNPFEGGPKDKLDKGMKEGSPKEKALDAKQKKGAFVPFTKKAK